MGKSAGSGRKGSDISEVCSMANSVKIKTVSPGETFRTAERLASGLKPGDLIALTGELGAGKTLFVKGLAKGLRVKDHEHVNSPSFVILKEYAGREVDLFHFDVYRLDVKDFRDTLDHGKYFYGKGITVIEWADKIREILPERYIEIRISYLRGDEREIELVAVGHPFSRVMDLFPAARAEEV